MMRNWRNVAAGFALGIAAAACGTTLRMALAPILGSTAPGLTFIPFVIAAAWYGGIFAGVTSAVTGIFMLRFLQPTWFARELASSAFLGRAGALILAAYLIAWLTTSLRANRDRAEREKRRTGAILEAVHDAFLTMDREFRIVSANPAAERLFHMPQTALIGRSFWELEGLLEAGGQQKPLLEAMQKRSMAQFEFSDEAGERWHELHAYPDDADGLCIFVRDISERKLAARALEDTNRNLEQSNAELQQFAYVAAHDLREPLRNLLSFSQLILRRYGEVLGEDGRQMLGHATQGARRMEALIDDLLKYTQVVGQQPLIEGGPVECHAVVAFLAGNFQETLAECGGSLQIEPLPAVSMPETQVMQLFQNLIGNGIKYRRRDVPPLIRVSAGQTDGVTIFRVSDNGLGIENKYSDQIFGLFKRLHGGEIPGTGIGLAICKRIVEHYGGRIWVESTPGTGSTFYFTLPAAPATPAQSQLK